MATSTPQTVGANENFCLKPVKDLLDGRSFYIPSYQRGYRWEPDQVKDLLDDIYEYAISPDSSKSNFYCLQPVVVKYDVNNKWWIVIDGQQRLTTLRIILSYLIENVSDAKDCINDGKVLYKLEYQTRGNKLDFDNINQKNDIDSYYAKMAQETIVQWFNDKSPKKSKIVETLMSSSDYPVCVIWYVDPSQEELDSIRTFNNLNKGKISLTSSELIKALFVLSTQQNSEKTHENINKEALLLQWNQIENKLQNNRFWYFLANKDYNPSTRIDLIFDFITKAVNNADKDYSYRKFQNLFNHLKNGTITLDPIWTEYKIYTFAKAWDKVKEVYHRFLYWYENPVIYHYIGFLVCNKVSLAEIYKKCDGTSKSETVEKLREMISHKVFNNIYPNDIDDFQYDVNPNEIRKTLLFFNIETCVLQQQREDGVNYYRFPFDLYKEMGWDIEHINSQKDNSLEKIDDKKAWLAFIPEIVYDGEQKEKWTGLQNKAKILLENIIKKGTDEGSEFGSIYNDIIELLQTDTESSDKHSIDNLTLLDSGTNRAYKNAPYPYKRMFLIARDHSGIFIPVCTRNLFLKYYSSDNQNVSQWKNMWTEHDRMSYLNAIHKTIDSIFKQDGK